MSTPDALFGAFAVPKTYPYALMGLAANFLLCQLFAPLFIKSARDSVFTKEHLSTFDGDHKNAFPDSEVANGGHPDAGSGWYSKTLPLADWVKINSAQRVVLNYIEQMPQLIVFTCLSAIYFPEIAIGCVWGVFVGRIIYAIGYKKAPPARVWGFLVISLCTLTMIVLSFWSCVYLLQN